MSSGEHNGSANYEIGHLNSYFKAGDLKGFSGKFQFFWDAVANIKLV